MRKTNDTKKVNTMKKSKSMRVAAVALALALVTSCFAGGTFAKYTTAGTGSDDARVAKFGVVVTANGDTFANAYDGTLDTQTVISADEGNVVAPGTEGEMTAMTITGTPEVAVNVAYDADLQLANWDADGYYCPLEITVDGTTFKGTDYADAAAFEAAVEEAIEKNTANYEANADMKDAKAPAVTWAWTIENNDDVKDTKLGDNAAAPTIQLDITTTVTQID